jgi:hypothetical protein
MKKLVALLAAGLVLSFAVMAADDIDGAYTDLKNAVDAKKGPAEIKPLAVAVLTFAAKTPDDAHAKEVAAQAEYALLTSALAAQPAEQVDLLSALETASPKSEYMASGYPYYLNALARTAPAKLGAAADKAAANFPDNQDVLVAAADGAITAKQNDRALTFASRALGAKGKADAPTINRMHFIIGIVQASKQKFFECNKELRAALPGLSGAQVQTANYTLGVCNYQLGHQIVNKAQILEAAKFMDTAAAGGGSLQAQAAQMSSAMKAEAAKMR